MTGNDGVPVGLPPPSALPVKILRKGFRWRPITLKLLYTSAPAPLISIIFETRIVSLERFESVGCKDDFTRLR